MWLAHWGEVSQSPDQIRHPTSAEACMWGKGLTTMLAIKRLAGLTPEVNLKKCTLHMALPSVNKAAYSGCETQSPR